MATLLQKSITREVQHNQETYKVVMSPQGIRVSKKGARRGVELSWGDILTAQDDHSVHEATTSPMTTSSTVTRKSALGMPDVVAADVILLIRRANETLANASSLIDSASELPTILAMHREPPRQREEERSDWYVEPLLTIRQVSQLLNISTRRVRNLPLKSIDLDGELRYHPAEVRRFLAAKTTPAVGGRHANYR